MYMCYVLYIGKRRHWISIRLLYSGWMGTKTANICIRSQSYINTSSRGIENRRPSEFYGAHISWLICHTYSLCNNYTYACIYVYVIIVFILFHRYYQLMALNVMKRNFERLVGKSFTKHMYMRTCCTAI